MRWIVVNPEDWTPDQIAHSLPAPTLRAEFVRQLNLTPISELPALARRWVAMVEQLQAAAERGREVHQFQQQHDGELPAGFVEITAEISGTRAA